MSQSDFIKSFATPPILSEPENSTPLDDGTDDGGVPTALLWALKDHRRLHLDLDHDVEGVRIGDSDVWAIDTDHGHCTIGRVVGQGTDHVVYCLIGTIKGETFVECMANPGAVTSIFSEARHVILSGVYESDVSNVLDVHRYASAEEIPAEYLPGQPVIDFPEDPEPDTF